jgi:putative peptidoglycan lipid II flippase
MARDIICASFFGAGLAWDVFVIAFAIPNMFRHLFGEGALSSAFIPAFVARKETGQLDSAGKLLNRLAGWMIKLLGTIVVLGMLIALMISVYSPDVKLALVSETVVITLPYLLLICLTAIMGAALNGVGRFASPAAAPILLNVVLIASAFASPLAGDTRVQLWILSGAVLIGGLAQFGIQIPPLSSAGIRFRPMFRSEEDSLREVLRAFLPAVVGLGVIQINEFCDNLIAELLIPGDGAVSALYYANRLNQLPLGIIGFSIATAAFPKMSADAARNDLPALGESLVRAVRLSLWVAIPAAVGLMVLPKEITALLFERGRFDALATDRTFPVVLAYAVGIPFYAATMVLTRAFYSMRDMKTPVRVSLITVGLNLALNVVLVLAISEAGIALATSITGLINFFLLVALLRRRVPIAARDAESWTLRAVLAAALAGAAAYAVQHIAFPPAFDTLGRILSTGSAIAAAIVLFYAFSHLFRLSEARQIAAVLRRR